MIIKKIIVFFLLITISVFIIPKEFIHSFYGHEDTCCLPHAEKTIEKKHVHCEILNYQAPVYFPADYFYKSWQVFKLLIKNSATYQGYYISIITHYLLRAPPVVVIYS